MDPCKNYLAVSFRFGVLLKAFRAPSKTFRVDRGRFRMDPCKNYMAVSVSLGGSFQRHVVTIRALQFWGFHC